MPDHFNQLGMNRPIPRRDFLNGVAVGIVSAPLAFTAQADRESSPYPPLQSHLRGNIPSESLPKVFDRFYRADSARARHSGGSGLGLSIMRQIVYLHGGDVKIESETSLGTTVSLTLPSLEP